MKISYQWIKQYLETSLTPDEMSVVLTSIGLEVEGMEPYCALPGGLAGYVIGEVLTCVDHPNSDHLHLTTVSTGGEEPLHIVCGAPNVAAGQKVVVATIGAVVYMKDGSFEIKRSKIRGEVSEGMLCAEDELGLGNGHDGIMVLSPDAVPGTPAADYFHIEQDCIFEIGLTPNRVDAASHYGVARDLAAWLKAHDRPYRLSLPSVDGFSVDDESRPMPVTVENPTACPRYTGVTISGVRIAPSPEWLQRRLSSIGLRPINNVVDITNFVLQEVCQPLHAFDADKIKGGQVIVKTLPEGTRFTTLDEVERKLSAEDLMICNTEEGMCIGGVFGGVGSGITDGTVNVFLESALFNPVWIRKTAKRHGLNTDASFRFERGVDPNITLYALKRAALLIREIAGGRISSQIVDVCSRTAEPFPVTLNYARMDRLIGEQLPRPTVRKILEGLEIGIAAESDSELQLLVPPYRVDVQREADVIEDILRIYGYNNVRMGMRVNSTLSTSAKPDARRVQNTVSDYLSANGFNEMMSNSLTALSYYAEGTTFPDSRTVKILNPLTQDLGCLRQTLLFGGLEAIAYNINRKNSSLRLYEFGNCYALDAEQPGQALPGYTEQKHLALFATGDKAQRNWKTPAEPIDFYFLKGYVERLIQRLGLPQRMLHLEEMAASDILSEGLLYKARKEPLVCVGVVQPALARRFDIKAPVYYADFNWTLVLQLLASHQIVYQELPKYPEVRRDLALVLQQDVHFDQIRQIAFRTENRLLRSINLFDVFSDRKLGEGKKSYAISFVLRDDEKTLTDSQIDHVMQRLATAFEKEADAQIRD